MTATDVMVTVLGKPVIDRASRWATRRRPRIIGYHDIGDPGAFEAQIAHLSRAFVPVTGAQVTAWLRGGPALPERAAWVTFDDGCPDVVTEGLAILARHGVPATLFVCPGVIESGAPHWWDVAAAAPGPVALDDRSRSGAALVHALQRVADDHRLAVLEQVTTDLGPVAMTTLTAPGSWTRQLTGDELRRWLEAGHELGNHTWDHPSLDRCAPDVVRHQIASAHDWLTALTGTPPALFAYPFGHYSAAARTVLRELGYAAALTFDHRLVSGAPDPLRLSRLRVDVSDPIGRARAFTAGPQSTLLAAAHRLGVPI